MGDVSANHTIGSQVPGEAAGVTLTKFGEGLSFDGRYVGFWGSWGSESRLRAPHFVAEAQPRMFPALESAALAAVLAAPLRLLSEEGFEYQRRVLHDRPGNDGLDRGA